MIKKLCITHSLSESGLMFADSIGGLINPSLAIHGNDNAFNKFGEIMLMKDPKTFKISEHNIFNADVYSARMPQLTYELEEYILEGINDLVEEASNHYKIPMKHLKLPYLENGDNSRIEGGIINILDNFEKDISMMLTYAHEKDIRFNVKKNELVSPVKFLTIKDLIKIEHIINYSPSVDIDDFSSILLLNNIKNHVENMFVEFPLQEGENYDEEFSKIYDDLKNLYCNNENKLKINIFNSVVNFIKDNDLKGKKIDVDDLNSVLISKIMSTTKKTKDYRDWLNNQFKNCVKNPHFFIKNKSSWKNKKIEGTLSNISKYMNKNVRNGEESVFKNQVGDLRSVVCKKITSLKEIEKNIEHIITFEQFKEISDESADNLYSLIDEMRSGFRFSASGFQYTDACVEVIKLYAASNRSMKHLTKSFDFDENEMSEIKSKIDTLLDDFESMKSPYFEAKSKVIYSLSDFSTAIVPKDTSKEVIDILKRNKVNLVEYDINSEFGKLAAINRNDKLLFGEGGVIDIDNNKDTELTL